MNRDIGVRSLAQPALSVLLGVRRVANIVRQTTPDKRANTDDLRHIRAAAKDKDVSPFLVKRSGANLFIALQME